MRVVKSLPPDVTTLLFNLGPRTLVLLEGDSDLQAFEEWYRERLGELMFHVPGGGSGGVQNRLTELLGLSTHKRVYGIIDRDFRSESEVQMHLTDPNGRLFVLSRYAIENYLLEPSVLHEELRVFYGSAIGVPTLAAVESELLQLFQRLHTIMAANWVLLDAAQTYFPKGYDLKDRPTMIRLTAGKIGCDEGEAEKRIAAKEAIIAPSLKILETAHAYINGKFALHRFFTSHRRKVKRSLDSDHLFGLLIRSAKIELHADIRAIVEDRILK